MLSTIGRAAIRRVGGGATQSTNRALQTIWHCQRVDAIQSPDNPLAQSLIAFSLHRSYATITKAAPKTELTAKSTTKVNPKTKAKVNKAVKKSVKKKPGKGKVTAKKPKPKAKPKRKPVKPLTEEQKLRAQVKELKIKALLNGPKEKPATAWMVLLSETQQGKGGVATISSRSVEAAAKYKILSPDELEAYNHTANQNKVANTIAHKKWIESHTPDQINTANNARKLLRKKLNSPSKYHIIQDSRLPKQPTNARLQFLKERFASGDFKGVNVIEANRLISKEWDALSASEKKVYEDRATADKQRYIEEYKTVFHRDSSTKI